MKARLFAAACGLCLAWSGQALAGPCATVVPHDQRGEAAEFASQSLKREPMRALAREVEPSVYLVWAESPEDWINLEAPVVLHGPEGGECEAGPLAGYAEAIAVSPAGAAAALEVPLCDKAGGICIYTRLELPAAPD